MDRIELATHLCHVSDRLIDARRSLLGSAGVEQSDVKASDQVRTSIELLKAIHETIATLVSAPSRSEEI